MPDRMRNTVNFGHMWKTALALGALFSLGMPGCGPREDKRTRTVGILLFAQHPVIDQISKGFRAELDKLAAAKNVNIEYIERNADGDASQANAASAFFRTNQPDIVFVVGVPAAQALKASGITSPVVFGGPPDPVAAGLVKSLSGHGSNFTGTAYFPPTDVTVAVFRSVYPQAKSVALLHNPAEANSMAVATRFAKDAKEAGLVVKDIGASNATELEAALRTMADSGVDGVFIPTDNLMASMISRIVAVARGAKVPLFNCTSDSVAKGADFSVGTDYVDVGQESAKLAGPILFEGKKPGEIDVLLMNKGSIYVRKGTTAQQRAVAHGSYAVKVIP